MSPMRRFWSVLLLSLPIGTSDVPIAVADDSTNAQSADSQLEQEPYATGWTFYLDNDLLSMTLSGDQGYTGGFGLSLSGRRAVEYPWSLDPALGWIDETTGWTSLFADQPHSVHHAWQIGTMAFTPDDTDARAPIRDDRPYASLVYIGNTRQIHLRNRPVGYFSNFTFGLLGTDIPKGIQNGLHDMVGDDPARGWGNQISDGGEPTFLWRVQRRQTHWSGGSPTGPRFELNSVLGGSVGYNTQVGAGLAGRWGDFSRAGWGFTPDYASNITTGAFASTPGARELYLWGGVHVHHQLYNAIFEGQFRDSTVTFDRERDLRSTIWEVNIGGTWAMANGYHFTLALRARQKELQVGKAQTPVWGSLIVGRSF